MKKSCFEQYNSNLRYLESTKFADHIFEIAGFVIFYDYCFIKDNVVVIQNEIVCK